MRPDSADAPPQAPKRGRTTCVRWPSLLGSGRLREPLWRHLTRFLIAVARRRGAEAVADAVLNHRQSATHGGVLGVYQRSGRWPEQVKAMELWGKLLAAAIEGRVDDANVVPITARAG